MMATTHALWGMLLGLPVLVYAPEFGPFAILAGLVGGIAPDLDLYIGHRKTLHFPIVAPIAAVIGGVLAIVHPSIATVILAVALGAAALHALSDIFGGGLELRPWEGTSQRAVYSHVHGRWISPRRTIRYDGAPEDLVLAGVAGVPFLGLTSGCWMYAAGGFLLISTAYVILRRRLPGVVETLTAQLPTRLHPYVPPRYLDTSSHVSR